MYQVWRNKLVRRKTEYIILTQAINAREAQYPHFNNALLHSSYMYTWGEWQKYFIKDLKRRQLPFHYFTELLDDDYVVYVGLAEHNPSYMIEELVNAGVVKSEFKHSIVIGIGENYNRDIPEFRMFEHLASKCLVSLLRRYNLSKERIVYFDDVLQPNWEEMLKTSNLTYQIETTKFFDKTLIDMHINKYKNNGGGK